MADKAAQNTRQIPEIPDEYKILYQGKPYITANGLTYLGHLQGLKRVDCTLILAPTSAAPATAIMRCEVETDLGIFADYGEVGPSDRNAVAKQYPVSMASTRARNRALRIATACPLTSYDEIGTEPQEPQAEQPRTQAPTPLSTPANSVQPAGDTPASTAQLDRLHKLHAALGRGPVPANLTQEEAATAISDMVLLFNKQSRGQAPTPIRQTNRTTGEVTEMASDAQMKAIYARIAKLNGIYEMDIEEPGPGSLTAAQATQRIKELDDLGRAAKAEHANAAQPVAAGK